MLNSFACPEVMPKEVSEEEGANVGAGVYIEGTDTMGNDRPSTTATHLLNSLTAKSVLAGEKLVATYSISM